MKITKLEVLSGFPQLNMGPTLRTRFEFDNGYGASVVQGPNTYGGDEKKFELAVLKNDKLCYDTEITSDVMGWLTLDEVNETLKKIENLS